MPSSPVRRESPLRAWLLRFLAVASVLVGMAVCYRLMALPALSLDLEPPSILTLLGQGQGSIAAPELDGGVEWLNTSGPLRLKDLKGKVVLLDFWTYCCINCIHILPDLEKLEKKYANQLVVIGVHSAKFTGEQDSKNIRQAILRYHIEHPVVNDANHRIWNAYEVRSWPTFWLIDPEGKLVGTTSGEGRLEVLDHHIGRLVEDHRKKGTLDERPFVANAEKFRERKDAPIYFPGKVLADHASKRIFIADSSHHRIVVTDLEGKKLDIIGDGDAALRDGSFDAASFSDPQGMALRGDWLYIADRKNHALRLADLKTRRVSTIAGHIVDGVGKQGSWQSRGQAGPALGTGLNSPWDLVLVGEHLYIAMAGHHQIWRLNLTTKQVEPFAGNGREDIVDGTRADSEFAQPSGLAVDDRGNLFVADSEVSAIRQVALDGNTVTTVVGTGLFHFGDKDGTGREVRLQHALGVAWHKGKLYVADTYNNKIKQIDPTSKTSVTWLGDGTAGATDDPPRFDEPSGIHVQDDTIYLADTNNHVIRIIDIPTKKVRTLKVTGVDLPKPRSLALPIFPNAKTTKLAPQNIPPTGELTVQIQLPLPPGYKLNPDAPIEYLLEASGEDKPFQQVGSVAKPTERITFNTPSGPWIAGKQVRISVKYFACLEKSQGICIVKSQIWEIPIQADPAAPRTLTLQAER